MPCPVVRIVGLVADKEGTFISVSVITKCQTFHDETKREKLSNIIRQYRVMALISLRAKSLQAFVSFPTKFLGTYRFCLC